MDLGAFSISLTVNDLAASRAFYATLGFSKVAGDDTRFLILRNGTTTIGLFQDMFPQNILTFNPGYDAEASPLAAFTDVREIQAALQAQGIEPVVTTDPDGTGVAHIVLVDPDGNQILIDQHVPRPASA
ncbi:MAG: VOC family protein [Alphaproteobacteria bacterium]|nr:VOC family protein [Alphaproteobacteria bacterium]